MVKRQIRQDQLFYTHEEVARPSRRNLYIQLEEAGLDWEKLAKPFEAAFSKGMGRPTDPVVYLKAFLVAYFENITYDTELADRIDDSKSIRAFLGYNLCEPTPDHSSISRNRDKIAEACNIEDVLTKVVDECVALEMVDGELAAVDGSLVPANASLSSMVCIKTGKSVREHVKEVAQKNKLAAQSGEKKEKLKVSNEEFVSKTDPDAKLAQKRNSPKDMCYKVTHVTDSKNCIIIAAGCAYADEDEREAAKPVLEQAKSNLAEHEMRLKRTTCDAGYDGSEFAAFVEDLGMEPVINYKPDNHKQADGFKKESFIYDKERDCYTCPRGCILPQYCSDPKEKRNRYVSSASDCAACPDKANCIESGDRRWLSRMYNEESRERTIARCHSDEGRAALKARKHIVEPPFGHMKTYGGMGLINCRGRKKANVKTVMAAVAYDLIKLVKLVARKRMRAASAAALEIIEVAINVQSAQAAVTLAQMKHILMTLWRLGQLYTQLLHIHVECNRIRRRRVCAT